MNKFISLFFILFLTGCASQGEWYKTGGSQDEYSKTKYVCLQESQQPEARSWSNSFMNTITANAYGESKSGVITNENLFNACMNAHGFYWRTIDRKHQ